MLADKLFHKFLTGNYHQLWAAFFASGVYLSKIKSDFLEGTGPSNGSIVFFLYKNESVFLFALSAAAVSLMLFSAYLKKKRCRNSWIISPGKLNMSFSLFAIGTILFLFLALGFFSGINVATGKTDMLIPEIYRLKNPGADSGAVSVPVSAIVLGRVSNHVKSKESAANFLFEIDKITVDGCVIENITENCPVVLVSPESTVILRDDRLAFNCLIEKKDTGFYLKTNGDSVIYAAPEKFPDFLYEIRQKFYICISNIFKRAADNEKAGFYLAVILGNTGNLGRSLKEAFRKSGIYHILSISGLHISFFILIIRSFLGRLLKIGGPSDRTGAKRTAGIYAFNISVLTVLFIYNFIVGQNAPVLRSTLMALFVFLSEIFKREHSRKYILSIAFILMLVFNPGYFSNAGFWLSFASVFAIVYLNGPIIKILEILSGKNKHCDTFKSAFYRHIVKPLVTVLSVNIVIFPILSFLFSEIPLLSPVTNIISLPLFYLILLILITGSISGLFWPAAGIFIIKMAGFFTGLLLKVPEICRIFELSGHSAVLKINNFGKWQIFLYYFSLLAVFIAINNLVLKRYNLKKEDYI